MSIVYTGGTFDLFHAGHVNFLRQCTQLGTVVVSLNTDEFIKEYKGKPPVMTYQERKAVLESCRYVSAVIPNIGGADSRIAILQANPEVIAIDTGWALKDYYAQMSFSQQWLDEQGILLVYIPRTENISSTDIKGRLLHVPGK